MSKATSTKKSRNTRDLADLDALLRAILERHSTKPIDKVCAIALPFQKRGSNNYEDVTFPIYDPSTPVSAAWGQLISSIASTRMQATSLLLVSCAGVHMNHPSAVSELSRVKYLDPNNPTPLFVPSSLKTPLVPELDPSTEIP